MPLKEKLTSCTIRTMQWTEAVRWQEVKKEKIYNLVERNRKQEVLIFKHLSHQARRWFEVISEDVFLFERIAIKHTPARGCDVTAKAQGAGLSYNWFNISKMFNFKAPKNPQTTQEHTHTHTHLSSFTVCPPCLNLSSDQWFAMFFRKRHWGYHDNQSVNNPAACLASFCQLSECVCMCICICGWFNWFHVNSKSVTQQYALITAGLQGELTAPDQQVVRFPKSISIPETLFLFLAYSLITYTDYTSYIKY